MDIVLTEKDVVRFWAKVDRRGPDECWLWLASKDPCGYGRIGLNRRLEGAHRIAFVLGTGGQPGALHVLHNCPGGDKPECVNPAHLWLGTQADNNRDKEEKGRGNHARGVRNVNSKLSPEDIPAIREKRSSGRTLKSLGEEYGVALQTIWYALEGKTWSHVQ